MRYRITTRWIPKDSIAIEHELGIVYAYQLRGKYAAVAYRGKSAKSSWHLSFKDIDRLHERAEEFFSCLESHIVRVAERRKASYAPHTFKVGDIVTNSWGYDQTNVDWYRVVRTSEHFVWLREVQAHTDQTGFMSGHSVAHIDVSSDDDPNQWGFRECEKSEETKHKASGSNCSMRHGCGSKWDGRPMYTSWYA